MTLNYDCIRDILIFIEENLGYEESESGIPTNHQSITRKKLIDNSKFLIYNREEVSYAFEQLVREELLLTKDKPVYINGNLIRVEVIGLTFKGHELLTAIENEEVWKTAKEASKKKGGLPLGAMVYGIKTAINSIMINPNVSGNIASNINLIRKALGL